MISVAIPSSGAVAQGTTGKIKGTAKEFKSSVKETVGEATADSKLEVEGKVAEVEGRTQKAVGDLKNIGDEIKAR